MHNLARQHPKKKKKKTDKCVKIRNMISLGSVVYSHFVVDLLSKRFKHVCASNSLVPPYWSPLSCDLCRKEGFQSSYRSPAHMAALPNRCFSFAPLQSLLARRNWAKEVIHDPRFFPPGCSQQAHTVFWMRSSAGPILF